MSSSKIASGFPPTISGGDDPAMRALTVSRRRRFIIYTLAFATMLAMSSVLDVRRAALNNRHAKLQLSLPSASLSSLSDATDDVSPTTATTTSTSPNEGLTPTAVADNRSPTNNDQQNINDNNNKNIINNNNNNNKQQQQTQHDDSQQSNPNDNLPITHPPPVAADRLPQPPPDNPPSDAVIGPAKQFSLSQQELDDGVDQLIAHVDQEESTASNASGANSTSTTPDTPDTGAGNREAVPDTKPAPSSSTESLLPPLPPPIIAKTNHSGSGDDAPLSSVLLPNGANSTLPEDVKLNAEDTFRVSQQRLSELLRIDKTKTLIDENDLRTLRALELQATRGDCELKSGASLFKTDAEAASNVDIERTHPLWGAWCLFMGSYKSDAMRDYVTKELAVEHKLQAALQALNSTTASDGDTTGSSSSSSSSTSSAGIDGVSKATGTYNNNNNNSSTFDPSAATLDDVMNPDKQTELRRQAEMVVAHLQENDLRYLAALSLQATFGDCGPYGRENPVDSSALQDTGEEQPKLRKLSEPLFEQTVTRKKGALWGAWCVMQGKRRSTAASNLASRVELLVEQLTKSQEAAEAEENGDGDMYSNGIEPGLTNDNPA